MLGAAAGGAVPAVPSVARERAALVFTYFRSFLDVELRFMVLLLQFALGRIQIPVCLSS